MAEARSETLTVLLFLPVDTEELFFLHFAVLHRHPVSLRGGQTCFFQMIASVLFLSVSFLSLLFFYVFSNYGLGIFQKIYMTEFSGHKFSTLKVCKL